MLSVATIRSFRDIICNRLPAALAMLKAQDVSIAVLTGKDGHRLQVTYWFDGDQAAASRAYNRCEFIYEMDRRPPPPAIYT